MPSQCQLMVRQILLEAFENGLVRDFNVHISELLPSTRPRGWLNQLTLKVPSVFTAVIRTLCLDDHVVHDHRTCHHLMH
jgi:hypothetical protein